MVERLNRLYATDWSPETVAAYELIANEARSGQIPELYTPQIQEAIRVLARANVGWIAPFAALEGWELNQQVPTERPEV